MYEPHADGALGPLLCSRALRLQGCWRTCVSGSCTCEGVQRVSPAKRKGVPAVGLGVKKLSLKGWGGSCLAEGWEPTAAVGLGRRLALGRENGDRPENRRLQRGPAELRGGQPVLLNLVPEAPLQGGEGGSLPQAFRRWPEAAGDLS